MDHPGNPPIALAPAADPLDAISRTDLNGETPVDDAVSAAMPAYRSHKIIHALEIKAVDGYRLSFVEAEFADIEADPAMFSRYTPVPGDRYMVYPDGYKSFSPKRAFEDGYTRV